MQHENLSKPTSTQRHPVKKRPARKLPLVGVALLAGLTLCAIVFLRAKRSTSSQEDAVYWI